MKWSIAVVAAACAAALAGAASANQINTGGEKGAYHSTFCPQLEGGLKKSKFDYACTTSDGSRENVLRVLGDPTQIGFSQLDVFDLESENRGGTGLFTIIRSDLGRECLFIVTSNKDITNYGQVATLAEQLNFVLPPQKSGSAGTFEYLQSIDPDGLGRAMSVTYAKDADQAIEGALSTPDTVTMFVQFPDPANPRFKAIAAQDGNIVPVIDRNILRQEINGEKVYFAEETEISLPKWNKSAEKMITACTPMLLFTGDPERVEAGNPRKDQEDLIKTIQGFKLEELQPKQGWFATLWKKTKELSAKSVEKMISLSEDAREKAKPMMEEAMKKAKEMADKAKEGAKVLMDKAKSTTGGSTDSGTTDSGSASGTTQP